MRNYLLLLSLFPFVLICQTKESDSLKVKADLSLTGFFQSGNVETIIFRAQSEFNYYPSDKWLFKTKNSYVYQEFGKEKADEDILSLNFAYLNPKRKIHPLVLGFVSTNFRRKIDVRYLFGGGVSFQIWKKEKNLLKLSVTSEYENTHFNEFTFNFSEYNGSETINTIRSTLWISGKYYLFKDKLILSHESFIQPSLEESNNYRWQGDIGVELPIWKFLNFKVNYLHTYESIVIEGQRQEDSFLTFGFKIKSY